MRQSLVVLLLAAVACGPAVQPQPSAIDGTQRPDGPTAETLGLEALEPDPREGLLAQMVAHVLTEEHLRKKTLDDALSREAFGEYVEKLDPMKLYLLASHVSTLRAYANSMDDQLRVGDLELARVGAALLQKRRQVVAQVVANVLAQPFDLDADEELETDPEKLAFVATEAELANRWSKVLKLSVLQRVAQMEETEEAASKGEDAPEGEDGETATPIGEIPKTLEGKEKKAREALAVRYSARFKRLEDLDPLEPAELFINAVTSTYDPHTLYLAPAEKENFDIQMSGSLEGIGAVLAEHDHYIVVREVVPGGASSRQGHLEAGDVILAVAQKGEEAVDVADMPINKVVQQIRGPKGTVVTLTVKKPDNSIKTIAITRDVVVIEDSYARGAVLDLGDGHEAMGYIYLPSFYGEMKKGSASRNASDDVRVLLEQFAKQKLKGVIIDLRGNPGGLLGHARDITGLFIEKGPVVQTRYSDGQLQILSDDDPSVSFRGEVVVMVDRFSASASEILAGALQDYDRAIIVGTGPTHGKGTVQAMVDLDRLRRLPGPSLGVLKLTIQQYYRVAGDSTQWRGVVPDIALPDPAAFVESGERFLDNSIPWSEVKALPHQDWPSTGWDRNVLLEKSKKRRSGQTVFQKIEQRSALMKTRREQTKLPLKRQTWLDQRKQDEASLAKVDPKLDEGAARFEVQLVSVAPSQGANGKASDVDKWKASLERDPWVEEALNVLDDMTSAP